MNDRKRPPDETDDVNGSTVMVRVDDDALEKAAAQVRTQDFEPPASALGDATVLGMQMPADDEFVPPPESARPASRGAALRRSPPVPAAGEPSPFAPVSSHAASTQEMGTFDEAADAASIGTDATLPPVNRRAPPAPATAPRRATGVRAAIPEPAPAAPAQPKRATGVRAAIPDPNAAPRRATGMRAAIPEPEPAAPPPPKRATGMRAAIPDPNAAPPQAKRATGMRQALPEPAAPAADPEAASSTVMFNALNLPIASKPAENAEGANSTVLFSAISGPAAARGVSAREPSTLDTDDGDTAAKGLAGDDRPTAARRPMAGLVDGPEDRDTNAGDKPVDPNDTSLGVQQRTINGMHLLTAGLLLLVGGAVTAGFVSTKVHKPSYEELELLYPFGPQGKVLPSGRTAPPAKDVLFDFAKADDCDGYRCLTYKMADKAGRFSYEMVIRSNDETGSWNVISSRATNTDK